MPGEDVAVSRGDGVFAPAYVLRVALQDIQPPIWRRLRVSGATTLKQMHRIIQEAMGWHNQHLYAFRVGDQAYGEPDAETSCAPAGAITLAEALPHQGSTCTYEYDFGDGWVHVVVVECITPDAVPAEAPACLAGARACPPEDCGGAFGYQRLLATLADSAHPQHAALRAWAGGAFDAEHFALAEANRQLGRLRSLVPKVRGKGARRSAAPPASSSSPEGGRREHNLALITALAAHTLRQRGLTAELLDPDQLAEVVRALESEALTIGLETLAAQRGVAPNTPTARRPRGGTGPAKPPSQRGG